MVTTIWVFPKIVGKLQKWMVKIMENPIKIHDLGGFSHYFCRATPIYYRSFFTTAAMYPLGPTPSLDALIFGILA